MYPCVEISLDLLSPGHTGATIVSSRFVLAGTLQTIPSNLCHLQEFKNKLNKLIRPKGKS